MFKDQDKDKDLRSKDKDKDKDCIVKDNDQDRDCILVLKESLRTRTRTRTNITEPSCLEKDIVQGCVSGSRSRGRQRRRWTEDIVDWTGLDINIAARLTEDRHRWRHVVLTANPPGGQH